MSIKQQLVVTELKKEVINYYNSMIKIIINNKENFDNSSICINYILYYPHHVHI